MYTIQGEFEWSRAFQGAIFSSYFYGYMSTQIIGGILSGKYGAKHVIGTGVLISGILTLITPAATRLNAYLLIVIRVLLGAAGVSRLYIIQVTCICYWGSV